MHKPLWPSLGLVMKADTPIVPHHYSDSISLLHTQADKSPRQRSHILVELLEIPSQIPMAAIIYPQVSRNGAAVRSGTFTRALESRTVRVLR